MTGASYLISLFPDHKYQNFRNLLEAIARGSEVDPHIEDMFNVMANSSLKIPQETPREDVAFIILNLLEKTFGGHPIIDKYIHLSRTQIGIIKH